MAVNNAPENTTSKDWDTKPELRVGGRTSQCGQCDRYFVGVNAFDQHMIGQDTARPRCLSTAKMLKLGMTQNKYGVWSYAKGGRKSDL